MNDHLFDPQSPTWEYLKGCLEKDRQQYINSLLRKQPDVRDEDIFRGRIKQIDRILAIPEDLGDEN